MGSKLIFPSQKAADLFIILLIRLLNLWKLTENTPARNAETRRPYEITFRSTPEIG